MLPSAGQRASPRRRTVRRRAQRGAPSRPVRARTGTLKRGPHSQRRSSGPKAVLAARWRHPSKSRPGPGLQARKRLIDLRALADEALGCGWRGLLRLAVTALGRCLRDAPTAKLRAY
jgi:hypothetical protein